MNLEISKIERYSNIYKDQVLAVWERSVLSTHDFLTRPDFEEIKELVTSIDFSLLEVYCLVNEGILLGFVGVADNKIEMLFLDPIYFGQGLGKKLLLFAVRELNANKLDVNEQNPKAVAFYQKFGFRTYERTETDEQGRHFPLLRMKLF